MEVGALTCDGAFLSSHEVLWRDSPAFAGFLDDVDTSRFCDALARQIDDFLEQQGYVLSDVGILGLPFPGPRDDGLWYSNNLIRAFRGGVALEREMADALSRLRGTGSVPPVRVLFDAQCDAGGELYHPAGRLRSHADIAPPPTATVLNVATGIAAGFVKEGRVLIDDEDFRTHVDPAYDGGAGQLGRHLWYHPDGGRWTYHFCPRGQTPNVGAPAIRMSERLSGPALAARLLLLLGHNGLFPHVDTWIASDVTSLDVTELYRLISDHDPDRDLASATQAVRGASRPVAGALLAWADDIYCCGEPAAIASCIHTFATQVAAEFAGALNAWMGARGWAPFGHHLVLTGGVGIRFLALSDSVPGQSFPTALASGLPAGCRVERSQLQGAVERECYLFLHQPAKDAQARVTQVHR